MIIKKKEGVFTIGILYNSMYALYKESNSSLSL